MWKWAKTRQNTGDWAWPAGSSRSAAAEVLGSGRGQGVLDEEGAVVVKGQKRGFGFDEAGEGPEKGTADVEPDPSKSDRAGANLRRQINSRLEPHTSGGNRSIGQVNDVI